MVLRKVTLTDKFILNLFIAVCDRAPPAVMSHLDICALKYCDGQGTSLKWSFSPKTYISPTHHKGKKHQTYPNGAAFFIIPG